MVASTAEALVSNHTDVSFIGVLGSRVRSLTIPTFIARLGTRRISLAIPLLKTTARFSGTMESRLRVEAYSQRKSLLGYGFFSDAETAADVIAVSFLYSALA
jgi:hypothetical protein